MKPKVGQRVFHLNIGNAARNHGQVLTPYVVTKVGRKYFTAKNELDTSEYMGMQYHIDSWVEKAEYNPTSRIFSDQQHWLDMQEKDVLLRKMLEVFGNVYRKPKLSLAQLREINEIISRG